MRRTRFGVLAVLVVVLLWTITASADQYMRAFFFYVGQAEATLLKGPDFAVLIDAGDRGRYDVVPLLKRVGVEQLDLVIITHPHADHLGQLPDVMREIPVREVWMSGVEHSTPVFEDAVDAILSTDAGYYEPRAGEVLNVGSLTLEILNPLEINDDVHESCLAMRAVFGDFAIVLTGDVEARTEKEIIERGHPLKAQILQLGHHGSRTSTSSEFLTAVDPEVAIYSAARCSEYDHPHIQVVERILQRGITLYGTDAYGTIQVITDGSAYWIETEWEPELYGGVFGQIEVNRAPYEELVKIRHIGSQRAGEILRLRPFESLDDLTQIRGIGPAVLRDIKAQGIAFVGE